MNWLASLLYYRDHSIVAILTQIGVMAEIDNADLASALSDILENLSSNLNCILIVYFRASVCNRRLHYILWVFAPTGTKSREPPRLAFWLFSNGLRPTRYIDFGNNFYFKTLINTCWFKN